ncbi:hypothetical protein TNCV_1094051 [Trichonephila clavipes]|uniref:Uncharacterized protein n=1 Tax=Trichonephila clavipes TaxID=2585209 RepID=A0A8X6RN73_TRICX|nr:hypothetical protein TNCV_1094051 [Trichonephila clavipes]
MLETTTLPAFGNKVSTEYPEIAIATLKSVLPFSSTYLWEVEFSTVATIKTKLRNKLDRCNTLPVVIVSNFQTRWSHLFAKKQAQGSH